MFSTAAFNVRTYKAYSFHISCKLTVDVDPKIDFADIPILQNNLVASIGCIMGSAVVQRTSSRERNSRIKPIGLHKCPGSVLDHLTDLGHSHSGLDVLARIFTDLAMDFGSTTRVVVVIKVFFLQSTLLFIRCPPQVAISVRNNMT